MNRLRAKRAFRLHRKDSSAEAERLAEGMRGQVSRDWRGHAALSPLDAERLFLRMKRDQAQAREELEQRLVAADEEFRSRLWGGLPADQLPIGVSPAAAMFAADRELTPRRESVLQHALSNGGQPVYHPIREGAS